MIILVTNGFTNNIFGQGKFKISQFDPFVPAAYRVMNMASGDLNNDSYADYVLVLQNFNETMDGDEVRPLLVIISGPKGRMTLLARNDSVVLSKNGGGVFGDPFKSVTIKNGLLTIEHSVGANWRWDRVISFTYNPSIKEIVLHKDADISYNISDPGKQTDYLYNKKEYNQLSICQYSFSKNK